MENLELNEFLESYLPTKFPNYKISGHNFMVNSIFCDDYKFKLGIDLNTGAYHCFKTGESGDFIKLYSILESMSYSRANIEINYKVLLKTPQKPLLHKHLVRSLHCEEELDCAIPVSPESYSSSNELVLKAWHYLMSRKIFDLKNESNNYFSVVPSGFYADRVVIPYVYEGKAIYFQARTLKEAVKPKYLCAKEGQKIVRGADILYPFNVKADYVLVCEGPIDARSLQLQGVNATCTTGTFMSEVQINALRMFGKKIVMAYDNDKPGLDGINKANKLRKKKMINKFYYCHPPSEFKDWNLAHVNDFDLKTYVEKETKEFNFENFVLSSIEDI